MTPENFLLPPNGWVPNNSRLPVLVYRDVLDQTTPNHLASELETRFRGNGWPPAWRGGIFAYHHYHSTSHELLAVYAGFARLMLGGPNAHELKVAPGDAIILPAGTGHCQITASNDFAVVGAYPPGQQIFDIRRVAPSAEISRAIANLAFPACDPIEGPGGALATLWSRG